MSGMRQVKKPIHLVVRLPEESLHKEMLLELAHVENYWIMFSKYSKLHVEQFRNFHP